MKKVFFISTILLLYHFSIAQTSQNTIRKLALHAKEVALINVNQADSLLTILTTNAHSMLDSAYLEEVTGYLQIGKSQYSDAIKHYHRSLNYFVVLNDTLGQARLHLYLARAYYSLSMYEEALQHLEHSGELYVSAGEWNMLGEVKNLYASLLVVKGEHQRAIKLLKTTVNTIETNEVPVKCTLLLNIALIYGFEQQKDSCVYFLKAAGTCYESKNLKDYHYATFLLNKSKISLKLELSNTNVLVDLRNAQAIFKSIGSVNSLAKVYLELARLQTQSDNYHLALSYLDSAQHKSRNPIILNEIYDLKSSILLEIEDYKNAYFYLNKSHVLDDSLDQNISAQIIALSVDQLEKQVSNLEKQRLISDLDLKEKEITLTRVILYATLALSIISFLFGIFYYRSRKKSFELQIKTLNNEAILAKLNPHFIFNCLNSIQSFYLNNEVEMANEFVTEFSLLIRQVLTLSSYTKITVQQEIDACHRYLKLEQYRLNHSFDFEIQLSDEIEPDIHTIPTFITQPILENAIWHGISKNEHQGEISLHFSLTKNKLVRILIKDNGIGMDKDTNIAPGHGLKLVWDRAHQMHIRSTTTGTEVEILTFMS